jgi:aconitate hydratase
VKSLSIANRATISNMAPEYGATIGFWPVDQKTIDYLNLTGRQAHALTAEAYYRAQELWDDGGIANDANGGIEYSQNVKLDLSTVEPSMAGPAKPHDRWPLSRVPEGFAKFLSTQQSGGSHSAADKTANKAVNKNNLNDGAVVIAAITSCTNTSNPSLMIGAALLARKARAFGLKPKPWVKTSFAPGSKAVTAYLNSAGLMEDLNALGFNLVGYGCTTCIGNSGPLPDEVSMAVESGSLTVAAVLSGNRNFEARIHPQVRANYLASPPLVVAFALGGRIDVDYTKEPLAFTSDGRPVFLKDLWPSDDEIAPLVAKFVTAEAFSKSYSSVFDGDDQWRKLPATDSASYDWSETSSYIKRPPFLDDEFIREGRKVADIRGAKVLGLFGDFITTDHISPAGSIGPQTPAGKYLLHLGIKHEDFNSYGARRGNHEIMVRGTFANVRLRNLLVEREGGFTRQWPDGKESTIYDASIAYKSAKTPLVIIAGREYGSGSSRDWAAKGTRLLGVECVIAESFERIHRSNLIGMGVLPLQFVAGTNATTLQIKGDESFEFLGLDELKVGSQVRVGCTRANGEKSEFMTLCRIDTPNELRYYRSGGILPYVLNRITGKR